MPGVQHEIPQKLPADFTIKQSRQLSVARNLEKTQKAQLHFDVLI